MNQQLSPIDDRQMTLDREKLSCSLKLIAEFHTLKRNDGFKRLQELADTAKLSRALVRLWAERHGLLIWHNRRAGTLIGTAKAKRGDDKRMKAIYG